MSYGFLDDRHRLFHLVTISASEREAAYLVDGLLHNDGVESTIHSTDTHGFTEVNFAVTYLIQVAFASRIQSFQSQQLYAFAGMDVPDLAAYALRPGKPLDRGLIEAQWETILRLIVSLKLNSASSKAPTRSRGPCSTGRTGRFPMPARRSSNSPMPANSWCKT